jgi:ankyrin repeat protein
MFVGLCVAVILAACTAGARVPAAERAAALLTAVSDNDLATVTNLLATDVDVDTRGDFDQTPLHLAILRDNVTLVDQLLQAGADPLAVDEEGKNAVTFAVLAGSNELLQKMLDLGVPVSNAANGAQNPLMVAAQHGYTEIGRLLIENGADLYAVDANGDPALTLAAYYGQAEFAEMLLAMGANPNFLGNEQRTALDYATSQKHEDVAAVLREVTDEEPAAAVNRDLFTAVRHDDLTAAQQALAAGASIEAEDDTNHLRFHPLQIAILRNNAEMAATLIEMGADPFIVDRNGDTLLFHAVTAGSTNMVKLLLEQGLEVNVVTSEFTSGPLSVAARDGSVEIGKLLIEYGADVEMPDQNGDPAFNSAAYFGQLDFMKMLMEAGANIDSVSLYDDNALTYADSRGFPEVVAFLREQGVTEP